MKTVSTKLDNSDFKRFQDMCNYDAHGKILDDRGNVIGTF